MIKVPYGISNFEILRKGNYYFVDRTDFIAKLEDLPTLYHFFLRPRRFGKSLWLSILEYYYDVCKADQFVELFGALKIGQNPTALANQYLVLSFDFSGIDTSTQAQAQHGFLVKVKTGIKQLLLKYPDRFDAADLKKIDEAQSPEEALLSWHETWISKAKGAKVFVLIDEYDHFTNRILVYNREHFRQVVGREGYYRSFFEVLKTATQQGIVGRIFVTGVTPVTLDSLTSGFNIGHNLTLDLSWHNLLGFNEQEVTALLNGAGITPLELPSTLADLRDWYNGYQFHQHAASRLYNPDMLLYFVREFQMQKAYPSTMLDVNISSDYSRISQTLTLGNYDKNTALLQELIDEKVVKGALSVQFSLDKSWRYNDMLSLLFYNGLITIESEQLGEYVFKIPNQVIRELYFGMFKDLILKQAQLFDDQIDLHGKMVQLAMHKSPRAFFDQVSQVLASLDNRDYRKLDEKHVKSIIVALLHTSNVYFVRSEYPVGGGYVDLLLLNRNKTRVAYQFAFELKYLKKNDSSRAPKVLQAAKEQLQTYLKHPDLQQAVGQYTPLSAWVVVLIGTECYALEEVGSLDVS